MTHKGGRILLACDLDRTVVPNGTESLSDGAHAAFARFVEQNKVVLVYATGRHLTSAESVLDEYGLSKPNVLIADVGTSIYWNKDGFWELDQEWYHKLASEWHSMKRDIVHKFIASFLLENQIRPQEKEHQGEFKLSYYTPEISSDAIVPQILSLLEQAQVRATVVHSINVTDHFGYLDILPVSADKLHALHYVESKLNMAHEDTVYAGDSGNDLEPLTSGCKAIIVNNASTSFKKECLELARDKNIEQLIYIAHGIEGGMNGNYTSGILEGLQHFRLLKEYSKRLVVK